MFASLSDKNGFVLIDQNWYSESLKQKFYIAEDSIKAFARLQN